jgi:hypothetical protein
VVHAWRASGTGGGGRGAQGFALESPAWTIWYVAVVAVWDASLRRYLPPVCDRPFYANHPVLWYGFIVVVAVVHGCVFLLALLGLVARLRIGRRAARANMSGSSVVAPTMAVINNPRDRVRWPLQPRACLLSLLLTSHRVVRVCVASPCAGELSNPPPPPLQGWVPTPLTLYAPHPPPTPPAPPHPGRRLWRTCLPVVPVRCPWWTLCPRTASSPWRCPRASSCVCPRSYGWWRWCRCVQGHTRGPGAGGAWSLGKAGGSRRLVGCVCGRVCMRVRCVGVRVYVCVCGRAWAYVCVCVDVDVDVERPGHPSPHSHCAMYVCVCPGGSLCWCGTLSRAPFA